jgi:glycosyltransferase involved in cell wall biosynthesis
MPRLLLLCEYPTLNGGERSMLATLGGVQAAGFLPAVAAPPEGPLAHTLRGRGIEVLPFQPRDAAGVRRPQQELREDLARLVCGWRPDLMHANSLAMGRLAGPVATELAVPSMAHLRDIVGLSPRAVADLNCNRRLLAVSQAVREFHVTGGLAAEKVCVLHNGVDLEKFQPRPPSGYLHQELSIPPGAPLVGVIGQISLRKGQDVLARAAALLAHQRGDVHYLVVGQRFSGKEESIRFEEELYATASSPGDDGQRGQAHVFGQPIVEKTSDCDREMDQTPGDYPRASGGQGPGGPFHFLGWRDDVAAILNELTLLVHPARQEPLGRVLLEAAATRLAIVATDVGGTREIFPPDRQAARLVPPGDPEAMAGAMAELLASDDLRTALGSAARRRAEEAFDVRRAVAGLVEHYQDLVQEI